MPPNPNNVILEAHEDRIQHLESGQQTLISQSTTALVKIDHLGEKIGILADTLQGSLQEIGAKLDSKTREVEGLSERIKPLEAHKKNFDRRWGAAKRLVLPLLIAAASVIATRFGEQAWTWMVR
jgi:chromosome segregation ATPase